MCPFCGYLQNHALLCPNNALYSEHNLFTAGGGLVLSYGDLSHGDKETQQQVFFSYIESGLMNEPDRGAYPDVPWNIHKTEVKDDVLVVVWLRRVSVD